MRCLLYINLQSGSALSLYSRGVLQKRAKEICDEIVEYTKDGSELRQIAAYFDIIMVCGGDGTLNFVINKIYGLDIKIVYLPCGTQNDFAKNYQKSKIVKTVLADVGAINDRFFAYVCATGTLCDIGYIVDSKLKKRLKKLAYIVTAIKRFQNNVIKSKIRVGDKEYNGEYALIMVLKSSYVAGRNVSKQKFCYDSGQARLILICAPSGIFARIKLFFRYFRVFVLRVNPKKNYKYIHYVETDNININFDSPVVFCVDGEKYVSAEKENNIKIYQKRLNIKVLKL